MYGNSTDALRRDIKKNQKRTYHPEVNVFEIFSVKRAVSARTGYLLLIYKIKSVLITRQNHNRLHLSIHFLPYIQSVLFTTRAEQMYKQLTQLWAIVRRIRVHCVRSLCTRFPFFYRTGFRKWKCETLPCFIRVSNQDQ